MVGTSNAQANRVRHLSRASAPEPEEKKLTDASFTRSTKARIASLDAAVTGVLDAKSDQARATINSELAASPGVAAALPPLRLRDINLFQTMNVQLRSQKRSN
jgi:hypothetical protein